MHLAGANVVLFCCANINLEQGPLILNHRPFLGLWGLSFPFILSLNMLLKASPLATQF